MNLARNILRPIAGLLGTETLKRVTGQHLILPLYHLVSDEPPPHIKHIYPSRSIAQFKKDLDFFLKHYKALTVDELGSKKGFFLSFDDGLKECAKIVAPILLEKGIPAAFFVSSDFIGNKQLFFRYKAGLLIDAVKRASTEQMESISLKLLLNRRPLIRIISKVGFAEQQRLDELATVLEVDFRQYLENNQPYMTQTQVGELQSKGFYVGNHTASHPRLSLLSLSEQLAQIRDCQRFLRSNFDPRPRLFSFPFTDHGVKRDLFEQLYKEGIQYSFGSAGMKHDSFKQHYHRIPMEQQQWSAKNVIHTEYLYYFLKTPLGKNLIHRL